MEHLSLLLSVQEINTILSVLQEQPWKIANPLIATIKQQADKQTQKKEDLKE